MTLYVLCFFTSKIVSVKWEFYNKYIPSLFAPLFQLLADLGIQRDLIPVGREVVGVILQGQKHMNKKEMWDSQLMIAIVVLLFNSG